MATITGFMDIHKNMFLQKIHKHFPQTPSTQ